MSIIASLSIFYFGTFLSSVGSLLLIMTIPVFFMANGIAASAIAVSIGIHRFSGIAAAVWFGPMIDRLNVKRVVIATEGVAAVATLGLWLGWHMHQDLGFSLFWLSLGIRALALGAQTASRNRLIKLLSENDLGREATFVIWLTKATQGAHIISALVALGMLSAGSLGVAILFDGFTFLLSGAAVWLLPTAGKPTDESRRMNLFSAFRLLVSTHRHLVFFDGLLALAVTGSILLMVKLSDGNPRHLIYFNLLFGACIWLSSLVAHRTNLRESKAPYWLLMATGFILLATLGTSVALKLTFFAMVYMGYWVLYHIYTVEFQVKTSVNVIGGITTARTVFVALILSLGELFGNAITRFVSIDQELLIRAGVCIVAASALYLRRAPRTE